MKKLAAEIPPPLEEERLAAETNVDVVASDIKIVTGFECSTPLEIEKISPTHFAIKITTDSTLRNWFMFRVEGARGRTVRIDIKEAPIGKWWSLKSVYSYCKSLDDPDAFKTTPVADPKPVKAYNGPMLPDTSGQKWHYMPNVWNDGVSVYSFVQKYDEDGAYVAMRVPYTPKYNEAYLASIKDKPGVKVIEVGKCKEGRPLQVVVIGEGDPKKVPCVLIYAREHANEHDSSWVVRGAITELVADTDEAKDLRRSRTWIMLPILDPDGAARSVYENICYNFRPDNELIEVTTYSTFFDHWCSSENRLDVVVNLHNVESAESRHLANVRLKCNRFRQHQVALIDDSFSRRVESHNFDVGRPWQLLDSASVRLGTWLSASYGPLSIFYEFNSQSALRHLDINEQALLGREFASTLNQFTGCPDGKLLEDHVTAFRKRRSGVLAQHQQRMQSLHLSVLTRESFYAKALVEETFEE